jgi:anti-anti-sigma factor
MSSVLCNTAITSSIPAEWSAPAEAIERITLTELVRGHDQDLFARLAPVVRRQSLLLDLELVERIDAAGIAALISLYRCATDAGYNFAVFNPSQRVAEILAVVGLNRILVSQNADRVSHSTECIQRPAA